jgi:hypothetical protein
MRLHILFALVCAAVAMGGCGYKDPEYLVAVQISPPGGTAESGSPSNTVQFSAIGWYATMDCGMYGCYPNSPFKSHALTKASWSSSNSAEATINSNGLATCVSPTSSPATITATAPGGYYGPIQGTATLICN